MLNIGVSVKVLPDAEYGGKYTGCVGIVKNYYSSKKKAGVELEKFKMMQVPRACSGFRKISWPWLKAPNFWGSVSESLSGIFHQSGSRLHRAGIPPL